MRDIDDFIDSMDGDIRSFAHVIGRAYALGLLSIEDHRRLAEWTGCYNYILPADRQEHQMLFQEIAWHFWSQGKWFNSEVGVRFQHLTCVYSLEQQYQIFLLIEAKKYATLPG